MNLRLLRDRLSDKATLGELFVDGSFQCYTLEDVVRDYKIPGETAIPAGMYQVTITYSPHFGRPLPLLNGVPNYAGVRIHPGNTAADTEGCILVGAMRGEDVVTDSRVAFNALFAKIEDAVARGELVWISIVEGASA